MNDTITTLEAQLAVTTDEQHRIDLMNALAWALREYDLQRGFTLSEKAYQLATQGQFVTHPYQKGQAESLKNLGYFTTRLGKFDVALSQLLEALALCETLQDIPIKIDILHAIGVIYRRLGDYPEALTYDLNALKLVQALDDKHWEAIMLGTLGIVYMYAGDYVQAETFYQKSLRMFNDLGNRMQVGLTLNNMAIMCLRAGNYAGALHHAQQSLQIAEDVGNRMSKAHVLDTLGQVYHKMHEYDQALMYFQRSMQLAQELGLKFGIPESLLSIGKVYMKKQQMETALSYVAQALTVAGKMEAKSEIFESHRLLAELYEQQKDFEQALWHYKQFHAIKENVFNEEADTKLKTLQVMYETETAKKEAEIYHLKNVALEQEIAERRRVEAALAQANQELHRLATSDGLTQVANRRRFDEYLLEEWKLLARVHAPLSLILGDIDYFKRYNDTYGHVAGDNCLKHVAQAMRRAVKRLTDLVGRYGGEEFGVILPATPAEGALTVARMIQKALQDLRIEHSTSGVSQYITLSMGIACIVPNISNTPDILVTTADKALYEAKETGRNRIIVKDLCKNE